MVDSLKLSESVTMTLESNYIFYSNREKVTNLLKKTDLSRNDAIDIYISLHLVLEIGINILFRKVIQPTFKKQVNIHEMIENLDNVDFRSKVTMFIYYSDFDFDDIKHATKFHKIIKKMKLFAEIRNKLLHGHSITEISKDGVITKSSMKQKLTVTKLKQQIEDFKFIVEGLNYYFTCLPNLDSVQFRKMYLNSDFIPDQINSDKWDL